MQGFLKIDLSGRSLGYNKDRIVKQRILLDKSDDFMCYYDSKSWEIF